MYSSGIPSSLREHLKPVLSNMECPRKTVIYPDLSYNYEAITKGLLMSQNLSFFLEEDLFSGNPLKVTLPTTGALPECAYLPRRIADSIPFSSDNFDHILSDFSIDPNSAEANVIKHTLEVCERPAMRGEWKTCTTSLEAMEEMAVETLGEGAKALSTKMEAKSQEIRTYRVQRVELIGKNYLACHRLSYPYAVHGCHLIQDTLVYETSLVRDDGVVGDALALCHRLPSDWEPNERLNVKPGKVNICHLFPKGHFLWLAADHEARIQQVV